MANWVVYILSCADGTFYTGITNNLDARLQKHENGTGAKYTKGRGPFRIVYTEFLPSRSDALKREFFIKGLSKADKASLAALSSSQPHLSTHL